MPDRKVKIPPLESRHKPLTYVTLAFLTVLLLWTGIAYHNSLDGEFLYDDNQFVVTNEAVHSLARPWRFFYETEAYARTGNFNIYRPLASLSFAVNYRFSELNPRPYHVVSYCLHLVNVILLFFLLRRVLGSEPAAAFAVLLFAVHPRNVEAVSWIASRSNLLFMFFFLVGFHCHLRAYRRGRTGLLFSAGSVLAYALSVFSKEMGITYPVVLLAYDVLARPKETRPKWKSMLPYYVVLGLVGVGYFGLRTAVLGGTVAQRSWHGADLFTNTLFVFKCIATYVGMTFWTLRPVALSVNYPFPEVVRFSQPTFWLSVGLVVFMVVVILKGRKRLGPISFGLTWFLVTILPVSNLIPIKTKVNDRFMYLPIVGLTLCVGWGLTALWKRLKFNRRLVVSTTAGLLVIALLLSVQTTLRNNDWRDFLRLFSSARSVYPDSLVARVAMAAWHLDRNEPEKTVTELEYYVNVAREGSDPRSIMILANAHTRVGNHARTIVLLEWLVAGILKSGAPEMPKALENLGVSYMYAGQSRKAINAFNRSLQLNPKAPRPYVELGNIYGRLQEYDKVVLILELGRQHLPDNLAILTALGFIYQHNGSDAKAVRVWQEAAELHPQSADIMNNLAWVYATSTDPALGKPAQALELASRAVGAYPANTGYLSTLAYAFEANGKLDEAVKVVREIIRLLPEDSDQLEDNRKLLTRLEKKAAASGKPKATDR